MDWRSIVFVYTRLCLREGMWWQCGEAPQRTTAHQMFETQGAQSTPLTVETTAQFLISTVNLITYRSRDTQTHLCVIYTCMWLWIVCIFLSYFLCFCPYTQHHGCFISYHLLCTSTVITNSTGPQRSRLTTNNIQAYGLSEIVLIRLSKANCTFVNCGRLQLWWRGEWSRVWVFCFMFFVLYWFVLFLVLCFVFTFVNCGVCSYGVRVSEEGFCFALLCFDYYFNFFTFVNCGCLQLWWEVEWRRVLFCFVFILWLLAWQNGLIIIDKQFMKANACSNICNI